MNALWDLPKFKIIHIPGLIFIGFRLLYLKDFDFLISLYQKIEFF